MIDVLIIGGGCAGISAAIYSARAGLSCTIIERKYPCGQIATTHKLENYPGIIEISGADFGLNLRKHAEKFGVPFKSSDITGIKPIDGGFEVGEYTARSVIVATGAEPTKLGIPGEEQLRGSGVSYCATCDGMFFKGRDVALVGGGDTALEEAIYLSALARKIYVVHRRNEFRAQRVLVERASKLDNIEFVMESKPVRIEGKFEVEKLVVDNLGQEKTLEVEGVFMAVGYSPDTAWLKGFVDLDEKGYVIAGEDTVTNVPGIFVAGDVRKKMLRQVVTAVADGAVASTMAFSHLSLQ